MIANIKFLFENNITTDNCKPIKSYQHKCLLTKPMLSSFRCFFLKNKFDEQHILKTWFVRYILCMSHVVGWKKKRKCMVYLRLRVVS